MRKLLIILTLIVGCTQPDNRIQFRALSIYQFRARTPVVIEELPLYRYDHEINDLVYCEDESGKKVILNKKEIITLRPDGTPFSQ